MDEIQLLALRDLRKAVALNPRYAEAHLRLGELHKGRNERQEAEIHFARALKSRPGWGEAQRLLAEVRKQLDAGDQTGTVD